MRAIIFCMTSPYEESISATEAARIWAEFLDRGTQHSSMAATLPYIIRRCEREGIAYRIEAYPGDGYYVKPIPKETTRGKRTP